MTLPSNNVQLPIDYLSYSAISMLERCPRSYYEKYILKKGNPTSWKMVVGSSFDEAVNYGYVRKKYTGADPYVDELQDFVFYELKERKDEVSWEPGALNKVTNACINGIKDFKETIITKVEPLEVQQEILVPVTPEVSLKGFIDLIDGAGGETISDLKTTWKKWHNTNKLWQLIAYSYAYELMGNPIDKIRYDVIQLKKRDPATITQFEEVVTPTQKLFVENKIKWAVTFIKAGLENPIMFNRNLSAWSCGTTCPYVDSCEKALGIKLT